MSEFKQTHYCPHCGGVKGRECFNSQACAVVTRDMEASREHAMHSNINHIACELLEALERFVDDWDAAVNCLKIDSPGIRQARIAIKNARKVLYAPY